MTPRSKSLGETPIVYTSDLSYDGARGRYLLGGQRYPEGEPAGHPVVLAIDAGDGKIANEARWSGETAPTSFVPWGKQSLVAFAAGGPGILDVLDGASLSSQTRIPTGARAEDVVIDEETGALYVADDLGRIHVLKLPGGEEGGLWEGASPLVLDRANGRLYANRSDGVVALDTHTGDVLAQFPQRGYPAPDPNADLVYIANRGVTVYDRSGKQLSTLASTFPVERGFVPNPYAYAAQVNPVTGHVAVILNNGIPGSNGGSFLRIYPRQSDKAVEPAAPHSFVMDVTADRKGNWYVAYSPTRNEEAVQVLSPDGQELRRLDHRTGYLALDDAKDDLYLFFQDRVTHLAASSLQATDVFAGPEAPTNLAFSPSDRRVYFTASGPLVTAMDLGAQEPLDLRPVPGKPSLDASNDGLSVAADGRKALVVGRYGEAYRTRDGATWERLLPGAQMYFNYATAVSPRTIFATGRSAVGGEAVWRSTDGGDTWEWLAAGLTDLAPDGQVLANSANEAYFLNRSQGLLRWDPTGSKWQLASSLAREGEWSGLSLAPDGALFRSNQGYLERSSDRGTSWARLGASEKTGDLIGYSPLYTVTHTLYSVVRSGYAFTGLQRSTDNGKTWQPSLTGAPMGFDGYQPEITSGFGRSYLLLRPYNGNPSLLRTTDFGATWQIAPAAAAAGVDHIEVNPTDGRLWLGVKGGVRIEDPEKLRWDNLRKSPPTPTATATPVPTPTAGPCRRSLSGGDAEINSRGLGLGCPRGQAEHVPMARQRFQNGQMIWRQDRKWIYVLYNDGRWEGYPDRWVEGDPADDPALIPPASFQQPARGFGKVWREDLGGPKSALGWALEKEQGLEAQAQDWDYGTVLRFGGEVITLLDRGAWR